MEKEFVTYQLALRMKALGFDEPCFVFWTNTPCLIHEYFLLSGTRTGDNIQLCVTDGIHGYSPNSISFKQDFLTEGEVLAPTFSQAFRFFRENHGLIYFIGDDFGGWSYSVSKNSKPQGSISQVFNTYEEAELACLTKLIEIVESKSE